MPPIKPRVIKLRRPQKSPKVKDRIKTRRPLKVNVNKRKLDLITKRAQKLNIERTNLSTKLKASTTQKEFTQITKAIEKNLKDTQKLRNERSKLLTKN